VAHGVQEHSESSPGLVGGFARADGEDVAFALVKVVDLKVQMDVLGAFTTGPGRGDEVLDLLKTQGRKDVVDQVDVGFVHGTCLNRDSRHGRVEDGEFVGVGTVERNEVEPRKSHLANIGEAREDNDLHEFVKDAATRAWAPSLRLVPVGQYGKMSDSSDDAISQILLGLIGLSRTKVFESDTYLWRSAVASDVLSSGLAERLDSSRWTLLGLGRRRLTHYGTVKGPYVTIFKVSERRNPFTPRFRGVMSVDGSGTVLRGTIGLDPIFRPFISVWLAFILTFVTLAVGSGAPVAFVIVPGLMFASGCATVVLAVRTSRRGATELGLWISEQLRQIELQ